MAKLPMEAEENPTYYEEIIVVDTKGIMKNIQVILKTKSRTD